MHLLALSAPPCSPECRHKAAAAWRAAWDSLIAGLGLVQTAALELEASLWVLSTVLERELFPTADVVRLLWSVPVLQLPPTPAAVAYASAALRAGRDAAARDGIAEEEIVKWLGGVESVCNPDADAGQALEAFLRLRLPRLKPASGADESPPSFKLEVDASAPWVWWIADETAERSLLNISTSLHYVCARHKAMLAAAAAQRVEEQQAAAAALVTPAGVQMHSQVASAVQHALDEIFMQEEDGPARRPPSQLLKRDHRKKLSWLACVLAACRTAVRLAASAGKACKEMGSGVPPAWQPEGGVSSTIASALSNVGGVLAEAIQAKDSLTVTEQAMLMQLLESLREHYSVFGMTPVTGALEGNLPALEAVFLTETTSSGAMQLTAAPTALPAVFDDDLDMAPVQAAVAQTQL